MAPEHSGVLVAIVKIAYQVTPRGGGFRIRGVSWSPRGDSPWTWGLLRYLLE